jgi:hypothetical protein
LICGSPHLPKPIPLALLSSLSLIMAQHHLHGAIALLLRYRRPHCLLKPVREGPREDHLHSDSLAFL